MSDEARCIQVTGIYGNMILLRPEDIIRTESGPGWTRIYTSDGAWRGIRETGAEIVEKEKQLRACR